MVSAQHTPGPWTLETVPTQVGVCHKVGPFPGKREGDKPRHACLYADYPSTGNPSDDELLANARLIAAAPELLEALRESIEHEYNPFEPDNQSRRYGRLQALYAKATGSAA